LKNTDNNSTNFNNFILNVVIFLLSAIVIFLLYIFVANLTGASVEGKNEIKEVYVPKEMLQIEILNGCGVSGLGEVFTDYLRAKKIDVVSSSNYSNFDVVETFIIDRIGNRKKAEYIASLLGIDTRKIITMENQNYFLDASVVLGQDYNKLKPYK